MLGELDLVGAAQPGRAADVDDGAVDRAATTARRGSSSAAPGSARLRGAILQVVANVIGRGMGVRDAVDAPRVHAEAGVVHCEDPGVADALEAEAARRALARAQPLLRRRERRRDRATATLAAAGDPRRGGASVVA